MCSRELLAFVSSTELAEQTLCEISGKVLDEMLSGMANK